MDFRQTVQSVNRAEAPVAQVANTGVPVGKKDNKKPGLHSWLSVLNLVVLVGALLLVLGTAFVLIGVKPASESKYVQTSKYQAVFLNNGQVYFGKVQALNSRFVDLTEVYYLTQATTTAGQASSDYTLVKLGCQQIHYPEDQMVISRDQVTFWENLNSNGKVAKSIAEFKKQNTKGENCNTTATQTQTPATNVPTQSTTNTTNTTTTTNKTTQ